MAVSDGRKGHSKEQAGILPQDDNPKLLEPAKNFQGVSDMIDP